MQESPQQPATLNELRDYVHRELCLKNDFEPGAFEITERYLQRGGQPCGIYFCLHGPRSVKITAIWETRRNTVLYYDSAGGRIGKTRLAYAPPLTRESVDGREARRAA